MPQTAIIWLGLLLLVLVVLLVITARRMSSLIARTRDLEAFQRSVAELEAALGAVGRPARARARRDPPPGGRSGLARARARHDPGRAARVGAARARAPAAASPGRRGGRAGGRARPLLRATDLVEHGLDALLAHRGHRELEAQTSLKRAALNLRNARGAAAAIAGRVAVVTPADLLNRPDGRETCRSGHRTRSASTGPSPRTRAAPHPACSGILGLHH